jgi:hypothetical protein
MWTETTDTKSPPATFNPLEYFPHLAPGEIVPGFDAEDPDGGIERIDYSESGKTLLFVLSATCGTCRKNLSFWNRILAEIPSEVRVIGLLVGSGESYSYQAEQNLLERDEVRFRLFRFRDEEDLNRYKVSKVPQTILIGSAGRVEACFLGELSDETVDEILSELGSSNEETP